LSQMQSPGSRKKWNYRRQTAIQMQKKCNYHFSVNKIGKGIDSYYVVKALQLYVEGISFREIERILGVSHVSVMNWVRQYKIKAPEQYDYRPTYKVLSHEELVKFMTKKENLQG